MEYSLELNITNYCQARCRTCRRTDTETGDTVPWLQLKHMENSELAYIVKQCKGLPMTFDLCGEYGDPMMHPRIQRYIDELSSIGRVSINTNGGLRNPEFYEMNAQNKMLTFCFSIDGITHDVNWKYREGVDWDRAWRNMLTWFKSGGRGRWEYLVFEWNKHQLDSAKAFANANDIPIRFKWPNGAFGQVPYDERQEIQNRMSFS